MDTVAIVGTCQNMCSDAEIRGREKAGLIHVFEKLDVQPQNDITKNLQQKGGQGRGRGQPQNLRYLRNAKALIKADKSKAVKEYTRPAAGVNKTVPSDLRPPSVLKKTVAYLCLKILTNKERQLIEVYDFVFDRLRAVRQDMVIQRINDESAIVILEAIVKFHLYSEHVFRFNPPRSYDPCINQKHLRDCLKTLLSLYGYNSYRGPTRPFFEALYCLSSPESYEVISRAFEIRNELKDAQVFIDALNICLAIQNRNFYKFFQLLDELPPLLAAFTAQQVPFIRRYALKAFTISYGIQTCKVPLEWVEEVLCYPNANKTQIDLVKIGCQIISSEDSNKTCRKLVKFSKSCPFMNDSDISVESGVKFTILSGLNNVDVIATEQICPWGKEYT